MPDIAASQFRELLEESVRLRLMARRAARHVPVGRHRQQRDRRDHGPMLDPAAPDVLGRVQGAGVQRARLRAAGGATRSAPNAHEIVIDDRDFFGALPKLVWHEDEPIAHPSSVPLYFVSALARQHVKVVLTGEGSDELLAGYGKYPRVAWNWRAGTIYEQLLPAARCATAIAPAPGPAPAAAARGAMRADRFWRWTASPESMFFDNFAAIRLADQRDAAGAGPARGRDADRRLRHVGRGTSRRRTAPARCSIACSTPTSRPTSSSC